MVRGRQERIAAKLTWEAIQRIELCDSASATFEIVERTAQLTWMSIHPNILHRILILPRLST